MAFEQHYGLTFPSGRDVDGTLFARYGVPVQPAWVFVTREGKATTVLGAQDESDLTAKLDQLATT